MQGCCVHEQQQDLANREAFSFYSSLHGMTRRAPPPGSNKNVGHSIQVANAVEELSGACDEMPHPLRNPCGLAAKEETRGQRQTREKKERIERKRWCGTVGYCRLRGHFLCVVPCFFWGPAAASSYPNPRWSGADVFCVSLAFLFKQRLRLLFLCLLFLHPPLLATPSVAYIPILV
ncbi:hypothetical protein HDV64DRAFT_150013 [Trichoderma sp. TUCIM 5745]